MMLNVPNGYRAIERLYDGPKTVVYRCLRVADQHPVVIKALKHPYPAFGDLARLRHQFEILKSLDVPGIIKAYGLEQHQKGLALILEDYGGISLDQFLRTVRSSHCEELFSFQRPDESMQLEHFFQVALQFCHILDGLHKHKLIHKDIKPENVLIHPDTFDIKLIDFSVAVTSTESFKSVVSAETIDGTIAYMSPEQTGRTNRSLDYRTDYYSLGITFYRLLTGRLPYRSSDSLQLIHEHIAGIPTSLHQINSDIPLALSHLVLKLMAKAPEDRYQTAHGLEQDLLYCKTLWEKSDRSTSIDLGTQDRIGRFSIQERLYGFEREKQSILLAYRRVVEGGSEAVLISGDSGTGKTSLLQDLYKTLSKECGYCLRGRFHQSRVNSPFSALTEALKELIQKILTEDYQSIRRWETTIVEAIGNNGQILIDVIPELELLIGPQPETIPLESFAAQNRFRLTFANLLSVFSEKEAPLTLFLDDLQWADSASLQLIASCFLEKNNSYFLLIGTYQSNADTSLKNFLKGTEDQSIDLNPATFIELNSFTVENLTQLIIESFDRLDHSLDNAQKLAEVIHSASKGNPLLSIQLLKNLYKEELIYFDRSNYSWQWNIHSIRSSLLSNLSNYSFPQVQSLSSLCQQVLSVAACCTGRFSKSLIAFVLNLSDQEICLAIQEALNAEFIVLDKIQKTDSASQFWKKTQSDALNGSNSDLEDESQPTYRFIHDRVQSATYLAIEDSEKLHYHLKIGTALLQCSLTENDEMSYEIIRNLNLCVDAISDMTNRLHLARLNFRIGSQYQDATAYAEALTCFTKGIQFLKGLSWQAEYELLFQLHFRAAECSLMLGYSAQMNDFIQAIEANASSDLDRVKALQLKIEAFKSRAQIKDAVSTGLSTLALLDIHLPKSPTPQDFEKQLNNLKSILPESIDRLMDLPNMSDSTQLIGMRVLSSLLPITYSYNQFLFSIILIRLVGLSVRYGNSPVSGWSYVAYAVLLWNIGEDVEAVYTCGEVGWQLGNRFASKVNLVISNFTYNIFIRFWKNHLRETLPSLLDNYALSLEVGDYLHASFSLTDYFGHAFWCGISLTELNASAASYHNQFCSLKQELTLRFYEIVWQGITDLTSNSNDGRALEVQIYDAPKMLQRLHETDNRQGFFLLYLNELYMSFLRRDYTTAFAAVQKAETYLDAVPCRMVVIVFYFYRLLTLLACSEDADPHDKALILEQVDLQAAQLHQWAGYAPTNVMHKYWLVQAERHRVLGCQLEAMEAYEQAITLAQENNYLNEEALAHELAGLFYLSWGKKVIAQTYLINAYYAYERWGAKAKLIDLENRHPSLLSHLENKETRFAALSLPSTSSLSSKSDLLDWASILRATQTLSQEMDQNRLLQSILKVIIENAGAEQGSLLLHETERLILKAHCDQANNEKSCELPDASSGQPHALPHSIINYVERTKTALVIDDATLDQRFLTDAYIQKIKPRSVLCMPIQRQNNAVGILYLENNLISGAFTQERLEVMQILLTQAAISLENAQLYASVEQKVRDRTLELETAKGEAETAKEKAELANVAKSEFLASMSHELRTPLNAVLGFSQILYRDPSISPEQQQKLSIIKRSGEHLLTLINDVLTMSKIESGRTRLYKTTFDLQSMLSSLHEMLSLKATEKDLCLNFSTAFGIPQLIHTDEVKLRQVLINLLGNALKFTQSGSVELKVGLFQPEIALVSSKMAQLEFRVEDTGSGVAPEEMCELFEAFSQTTSGRTSQEGTGLGLPISRTFIQLMGGDIQVSSVLGQGSCFSFNILVDLPEPVSTNALSGSDIVIGLAPGQPSYRILAVEDQLENQQVIQGLLQPIDFDLEIVSSGSEAIIQCENRLPHLILMDLQMPGINGFQAAQIILEKVKQSQQSPPVLIALTANAFEEVRSEALKNGFSDFISKPFQAEKLLKVIAQHLNLQYCYRTPLTLHGLNTASEPQLSLDTLTPELVQQLSSDWRKQVHFAAQRLDEPALLELVAQIKVESPLVARLLTGLIRDFDFEKIFNFLNVDSTT